MVVRTRLAVARLEDRWVPADATPTAAQIAAAAQQAGLTPAAGTDADDTEAATTTTETTTTPAAPAFLADRGARPVITPIGTTGTAGTAVSVYDAAFTGGVWVARADVTGDGTADSIAAPGPGVSGSLRIVDGADGRIVRGFDAYEVEYTGGVVVAAADLNQDGRADVITGTDQGGGPRVRVFDGLTGASLADFFAIDDPAFRGGVRVAAGDVDADGVPDVVAAAGFGGGPRVAVWDGEALLRGVQTRLCGDFFAFEPGLRNGVYPAVGAFDSDGFADLLIGAGPGGGPRVKAVSGQALLDGNPQAAADAPLLDFFAGLADDRGGVRAGAIAPSTAGGVSDILTVGGSGGIGTLYNGTTLRGLRSVDRELALSAGLLSDATGERPIAGTTTTSTGGTGTGTGTGGTTPGGLTAADIQDLLDALNGQLPTG